MWSKIHGWLIRFGPWTPELGSCYSETHSIWSGLSNVNDLIGLLKWFIRPLHCIHKSTTNYDLSLIELERDLSNVCSDVST